MYKRQLEEYYADDARRFHGVVDRILSKFGGIYQKDKDDFYSLANEVLADACRNYDETKNFDGYVSVSYTHLALDRVRVPAVAQATVSFLAITALVSISPSLNMA